MERLGSLDAIFLAIETATCPMAVGQVTVFEGPAPDLDEIRTAIGERAVTVDRCRQRVQESWGRLTRPVWVEVVLDVEQHVHQVELAEPSPAALERFVERTMVVPMDRRRPLWEVWVVPDVGEGRWAVLGKVHHCMVDGLAGTDLLSVLLAPPRAPASEITAPVATAPVAIASTTVPTAAAPSPLRVTWFGVVSAIDAVPRRLRRTAAAAVHPVRSRRRARDVAAGARALWLQPRRRGSPLTGAVGPRRRWARIAIPLAEVDEVRRRLGGSVNDVVLAATTLGFRSLLDAGGATGWRDVMTLVPVSTRAPDERGVYDNRVAVTHALLPVGLDDPLAVHSALRRHLAEVRASHQAAASTLLLHSGDLVPNRIAGAIAHGVVRAQRDLETVTTNVPGPVEPLFLCGRRMSEGWPFAPIAGRIRIVVAIWSSCGRLFVGVTGDGDTASDVDALAAGIGAGIRALSDVAAGGAAGARSDELRPSAGPADAQRPSASSTTFATSAPEKFC